MSQSTALSPVKQFEAMLDKSAAATFNARRADPEMKWAVEKRFALETIARNDELLRCNPRTIVSALISLATMGLSLDPNRKHAYLVPRALKRGQTPTCLPCPSYMGLEYLAHQAGGIASIQSNVVRENDVFEHGLDRNGPYVEHQIRRSDRGEVTHAYTMTFLENGQRQLEVMDRYELDACRAAATHNGKVPPSWKFWETEMMKKCVSRRASKHWPISSARLSRAIEQMDKAEPMDVSNPTGLLASNKQVNEIKALIKELGMDVEKTAASICAAQGVDNLSDILSKDVGTIKRGLRNRAKARSAANG